MSQVCRRGSARFRSRSRFRCPLVVCSHRTMGNTTRWPTPTVAESERVAGAGGAPGKPWRNNRCCRYRKTRSDPAGYRRLPSKVDHQLEPSVAWRPGNRRDEAYTGSVWAVRLSPERPWCGGRRRLPNGRLYPTGCMVWPVAPPGSENRARTRGLPRNLGGPSLLREERWKPDGRDRSGVASACIRAMDEANKRMQRSTARRGNEARRDE